MRNLLRTRKTLLKITLISLTLISLTSCNQAPKFPEIKKCRPIIILDEIGKPNWESSYVFCVLRSDPQNEKFHERIPVHQFLLGENDGNKPILVRSADDVALEKFGRAATEWAKKNCNVKE